MRGFPFQPFDLAGTLARQANARAFDPNPIPALSFGTRHVGTLALVLPPRDSYANIVYINGVPTVEGAPIPTLAESAQDQIFNTSNLDTQKGGGVAITQVYDGSTYGEASIVLVTFTGPNSVKVLDRPANTRSMLLVANDTVVGTIRYNWNKAADSVGSMPIAAGGSRNFSPPAVPQGDLWIFSPGAGNVIIEYMNTDLRQ